MAKTAKKGSAAADSNDTAAQDAAVSAAAPDQASEADTAVEQAGSGTEQATPEVTSESADSAVPAEEPAATSVSDTAAPESELDAVNTQSVIDHAPEVADEVLAAGGVDTAATAAPADHGDIARLLDEADELVYPVRFEVSNNTRMPVQIMSIPLELNAAPSSAKAVARGADEFRAFLYDLDAIRRLNNFNPDAYAIEVLPEDHA